MWCRAILTITLLACTFQRTNGQSHDTKDLLCVLILSGLQKEDLDVALLRKLKRHDVNIDDLDNADIRNECKLENANYSDNETKNDVQNSMRRNFQSNQTTSDIVQTKEVNPRNEEVPRGTNEEENITKLIKLISNITPEINILGTKEDTTTLKVVTLVSQSHNKSDPNSITYINKVLQQFFAQVHAAAPITTSPATTVDFKQILYEIKDMLANKSVNPRKESTEDNNGQQEYNFDDDSLKIKVYTKALTNRIMNKMKGMRRHKENVGLVERSQEVLNERPIKNYTESLSSKSLPKKTTNHAESSPNDMIPGDIIKDIAESVKAIVLQDLKKEMSTTTSTTTASTTDIETTTNTKTKQETDFAQIMKLFQQFKNNIIPVVNNNLTGQIQHEIKSSVKLATPTFTTVPNNPYNYPILNHIVHNIQVPNTITNLDTELQTLPFFKQQHTINRIDQVNIFNPKHEIHPMTIQTNVGQVPPLSIPMMAPPLKMIYQNIVVTTENSFEYFKNLHKHKSPSNVNTQYIYSNDNKKLSSKPQHAIKMVDSPKYYIKSLEHTKKRSQPERMRTPSYYNSPKYNPKQKYGHVRSKNHNFERFHEKLERADRDDWQQNHNEHNNEEKMRVAPRQQRPLSDNKPKFDNTHFNNFLKTQEKVNNMLERILATKTIEGPKSVETP